ncbi:cardiolipin synthase [Corynebacterium diphtheriae bv. mitis]|uniref:cardiolipin synthase n=1 Tax=Corynebacterium diphtheriae TaxID=1717 RepID=UPI0013CB330B|nr:cardiolipin synthase [Corynebacterium diphtheriae]MBG9313489.1 cardiolipin synthase [Corynebacterium diphtheriae bv. mitis]CAB0661676.1 cardiolipin synthase [Corynebacterium diphtheriae]CAB0713610.1 cardiolipin synthase [Corynebacterium diphtheriae]CAB0737342.1 cardiolipin synthase [Corynebacterium diphtheriae]CAB0759400.1 cardiolipin synthase [Corynebacterium diphtheriae]
MIDWQTAGLIIDYAIKIVAIGFVPEGRRPSSSTAWLLAILLLPFVGLPLFLLMGSPYINRRRHDVQRRAFQMIRERQSHVPDYPPDTVQSPELTSMIRMNRRLTAMTATTGSVKLHSDYEETIQAMADAVDQARDYVHVQIYIVAWDDTTDVFFRALERAVQRGVEVRLLFDQVGSWKYPGYRRLGKRLTAIGVDFHLMLPLQPFRWRFRRPDLRNHRKLLIIDGQRGFIGSQNMIASHYTPRNRSKGRHWVDVMVELEGPIVASMNTVFVVDWSQESHIVPEFEVPPADHGDVMQIVPSGPGFSTEPNLRLFNEMIHHAKSQLIMCSPYFIPDESMLEAVTSACYRGVRVELLVSEQADQFVVDHAQSSYYQTLLEAGVHIYRYHAPAVLHSKFLIADPHGVAVSVMGSSNMDMRSFGLNYEVSLMTLQGQLTHLLYELAETYKENSTELTLEEWNQRGIVRRYVDNIMKLTSALQ